MPFLYTALGLLVGLLVFFLFGQVIMLLAGGGDESENIRQDQEIQAVCDDLRFEQIHLLQSLGSPADNGRWSAGQTAIWNQVHALETREQEFLKSTEVVNLETLGHRIGRVYRKRPVIVSNQKRMPARGVAVLRESKEIGD